MKTRSGFCGNAWEATVTSEPPAVASLFFCKAADYLCLASELKSSGHQRQNSTIKPFQLSNRNLLFTVQFHSHEQRFPERMIQKLKLEHHRTPRQSLAFEMTTSKTSRTRGFKVNSSSPGWSRKWIFHRRRTVCYRTAALERSPDGSSSRLKNKRELLR